jgi:hypothetical protein
MQFPKVAASGNRQASQEYCVEKEGRRVQMPGSSQGGTGTGSRITITVIGIVRSRAFLWCPMPNCDKGPEVRKNDPVHAELGLH